MRLLVMTIVLGGLALLGMGMQLGKLEKLAATRKDPDSPEGQAATLVALYAEEPERACAGLRLLGGPAAYEAARHLFDNEFSLGRKKRLMDLAIALDRAAATTWFRELAAVTPPTEVSVAAGRRLARLGETGPAQDAEPSTSAGDEGAETPRAAPKGG